jgi:hypothetical protein
MFCVIQEIERKKANRNGYYKELKSEWLNYSFNGEDRGYYYHNLKGQSGKLTVFLFMKITGKPAR